MGLFSFFFGTSKTKFEPEPEVEEEVSHEGFKIKPAPQKQNGSYHTAGYIRKADENGNVREHFFIRADTHAEHKIACEHAIFKAKQIIDQSGERIFD